MPATPRSVADRLLDAQVEFVLAQLEQPRFGEVVAEVVDEVLGTAQSLVFGEVVDREDAKALVRTIAARAAGSTLVPDYGDVLATALHGLAASDEHLLGDVLDRDAVEALIAKVLGMRQFHDRVLERLTESPTVTTLMTTFVSRIVGDVLAQNRARAEKVPGISSLFSLGTSAASRVKGVSDQILGDVTGRSAAYTIKRTNGTIRDLMQDEQIHAAAMEIWDLHAQEPVGALRGYLAEEDLRELVALVHAVITGARATDYADLLLDECVDVFFDRYGEYDLAALLDELGVQRDDLVAHVTALAAPVITTARDDLARLVRARLEPFFRSDAVAAILT